MGRYSEELISCFDKYKVTVVGISMAPLISEVETLRFFVCYCFTGFFFLFTTCKLNYDITFEVSDLARGLHKLVMKGKYAPLCLSMHDWANDTSLL